MRTGISNSLPDSFPVLNGHYPEFNAEWYQNVGSTITLALLIGIVSPHLSNLVAFGIFLLVQRIKKANIKENSLGRVRRAVSRA